MLSSGFLGGRGGDLLTVNYKEGVHIHMSAKIDRWSGTYLPLVDESKLTKMLHEVEL